MTSVGRASTIGHMNWSPAFAIGLLIVLLAAVAVAVFIIGFFNVAMVAGPFLLVFVVIGALIKAGRAVGPQK